MPSLVSPAQWAAYKALHKEAHETFHQKTIIWKRLVSKLDRFGEDSDDNGFVDVPLKVLLNYNYLRSWPITNQTETGANDRESVQILINKEYLGDLGFLNADGYFVYDKDQDYIMIDGLKHKPFGDTHAAQMQQDDILFTMIVKREETLTGDVR